MSRLLGEKISYQDALNHYVGAFILIPAMIVGVYLMFMNFKAAEELADMKVKDTADVIAQNLSLSMTELRSELESSVSNPAFIEAIDRRGSVDSVSEWMKVLVDGNPFVAEAVIRGMSGDPAIGFPASSIRYSSVIMDRTTQRLIAESSGNSRARLYLLEDLRQGPVGLSREIPVSEKLFFAVPVPVTPETATAATSIGAVLWVRVDLSMVMETASRPDWATNSRYSLAVSDNLLFESHTVNSTEKDRIASSAELGISVVRAGATLPIRFGLSENSRFFTAAARDFFVKGVLALLAMGALLALLMKQFSAMLNRPLKKLISYSQHISDGDYEEAPTELVFDEFEQLRLAMTKMADKVQKSMEQLEYFASTDFLTGLMNRRSFDDTGEREFERATRAADPQKTLWLIILDIDHFKRVNDTAGHTVGDLVIQAVAAELASISRKSDIVGRLGGEEYGILLPEATRNGVKRVADQILARVPELVIDEWTEVGGPVTVSIGCACFFGKKDFDELYRIADESLYASKWNGRNQISFEEDAAANDTVGDHAPAAGASNQ